MTSFIPSTKSFTCALFLLQVTDFFEKFDDMHNEMKWQRKLKKQPVLSAISGNMSLWSRLLFLLALTCNLIVAGSFPFDDDPEPG